MFKNEYNFDNYFISDPQAFSLKSINIILLLHVHVTHRLFIMCTIHLLLYLCLKSLQSIQHWRYRLFPIRTIRITRCIIVVRRLHYDGRWLPIVEIHLRGRGSANRDIVKQRTPSAKQCQHNHTMKLSTLIYLNQPQTNCVNGALLTTIAALPPLLPLPLPLSFITIALFLSPALPLINCLGSTFTDRLKAAC
jgi:hypothetical protein